MAVRRDLDLLTLARKYVVDCLDRESPPRVDEFAARLAISRTRLNQLFLQRHAMTLSRFFTNERIEFAKRLLRETDLSITQIAYHAAFGTRRTFHRAFLRATGMTPQEYRLKSSKCL